MFSRRRKSQHFLSTLLRRDRRHRAGTQRYHREHNQRAGQVRFRDDTYQSRTFSQTRIRFSAKRPGSLYQSSAEQFPFRFPQKTQGTSRKQDIAGKLIPLPRQDYVRIFGMFPDIGTRRNDMRQSSGYRHAERRIPSSVTDQPRKRWLRSIKSYIYINN